jgi:hypothetical protein
MKWMHEQSVYGEHTQKRLCLPVCLATCFMSRTTELMFILFGVAGLQQKLSGKFNFGPV